MHVLLSLVFAALLAVVHLFAGRMRFLSGIPRSIWLSMAAGVSVAYVFVHLLPELGAGQAVFREQDLPGWLAYVEHHVYLLALVGLVTFYGLERAALNSRRGGAGEETTRGVFRLHVASFAVYNALIGYLLVSGEEESPVRMLLFAVAMALHFVVNDIGLRSHFTRRYHQRGRWVLAVAILAGWALGLVTTLSETAVAALVAFLSGGIVLNVLKEELPEERESRFWAFALGGGVYTALLLGIA